MPAPRRRHGTWFVLRLAGHPTQIVMQGDELGVAFVVLRLNDMRMTKLKLVGRSFEGVTAVHLIGNVEMTGET